ncbi:MAG: hypothetical protein KF687_16690 [Cyclobacteriaceae bacterium]|nr:hypothetical protein [Cyclobacteriaceae bacterium]
MANVKTRIDEWSVRDLEDNSTLTIAVDSCTELGNHAKPGIQVHFMGTIVNYEPLAVERWNYLAKKEGVTDYLLEKHSWMYYPDRYVKTYLVTGTPLKAKVEVKTRSSEPVIKEYVLPMQF